MTPEQKTLRARIAAHERWAQTPDRTAATAAARLAAVTRWERQVDPDGILDPRERSQRAESAKKAYYVQLALKSVQARAARAYGATTYRPTSPAERLAAADLARLELTISRGRSRAQELLAEAEAAERELNERKPAKDTP